MIRSRPVLVSAVVAAALSAACAHAAGEAQGPPVEPAPAAVASSAAAYAALEQQEVDRLSRILDTLIDDPVLVAAFRARDREKLLARARKRFERLKEGQGITHWYFLDPEPSRTCFLRVHAPTLFGDVVARETFSRAIASKEIGHGKELGKTAFALRVVKPIRARGAIIGYMELGREIGDFLVQLKEQTGDDFGLFVDKKRLDRKELAKVRGEDRWDERPDVVLIDSTVWNERLVDLPVPVAQVPDKGMRTGEWIDGNRKFLGGAFPVRDAADQVVGVLYVRHPVAR